MCLGSMKKNFKMKKKSKIFLHPKNYIFFDLNSNKGTYVCLRLIIFIFIEILYLKTYKHLVFKDNSTAMMHYGITNTSKNIMVFKFLKFSF